jgi:hypothetical protein
MSLKLHTQQSFSDEIERLVNKLNISYLDAILHYCAEAKIEVDTIGRLLSKPIKHKLEAEATELNLINRGKKHAKLPLK